jgi:hypothetical protein
MSSSKIIVHCLVKNEERFIWYALKSTLPFVDKIMVWDTGSTDNTIPIIKSIKSRKISFKQVGEVDQDSFTLVRQQMLDETPKKYTWLMVLDGDEIWSRSSIQKVVDTARTSLETESVVVRTHNLVGDIYHRLPESLGQYQLAGKKGHLALRLMNLKKIKGLCLKKPHGQQGYFDSKDRLVQERELEKIKFVDVYYHHATHLQRSANRILDKKVIKRSPKLKCQLGKKIPSQQIPDIFFQEHPSIVPKVTQKAPLYFWIKACLLTPPKLLKKVLLPVHSGY